MSVLRIASVSSMLTVVHVASFNARFHAGTMKTAIMQSLLLVGLWGIKHVYMVPNYSAPSLPESVLDLRVKPLACLLIDPRWVCKRRYAKLVLCHFVSYALESYFLIVS